MKEFLLILGICIGVIMIGVSAVLYYNNSDYFNEYFESKRNKLNLMNEASVDSLVNVITQQSSIIDSLENNTNFLKLSIDEINKANKNVTWNLQLHVKELRKSIKNKDNMIEHQNGIISKLAMPKE